MDIQDQAIYPQKKKKVRHFWIYTTVNFFKAFSLLSMCVKILSIEKKKKNTRSSSVHTLQVMSQLPKLFLKTQLEILKVFCPMWKAPFDLKDIFLKNLWGKYIRRVTLKAKRVSLHH